MSSVKHMEVRWRAGHRGEEPGQSPRGGTETDRQRWRGALDLPLPHTEESGSGILLLFSVTHTLVGPGGHSLALSHSTCTHHNCGDALSPTDVERKAHSDDRPAREGEREEREGERERERERGISIIL